MHIALLAGEPSGDQLGAELMLALRKLNPAIRFDGVGGYKMEALGFHSLVPMSKLSVMGFAEVAKALPRLFKYRNYLYEYYQSSMPDAFIGIDFPDFNLSLETRLKHLGIYTVHYVSPSVWAWREGRVHSIRNACDIMLTLFDFEKQFYDAHDVPAIYCGHPLTDTLDKPISRAQALSYLDLELKPEQKVLAILPGSRDSEVRSLLPVFLKIAHNLRAADPELRLIIPATNTALKEQINSALKKVHLQADVIVNKAQYAMQVADAVLLASGTATLEAALLQKPMLVAYKVNPLTAMIARFLVNTPHFSLPNIIADGTVVPEYIQGDINIEEMSEKLHDMLYSETVRDKMIHDLAGIRKKMQPGGAKIAANAIYQAIIQSGLHQT